MQLERALCVLREQATASDAAANRVNLLLARLVLAGTAMSSRLIALAVFLVALASATGCYRVKPYEREAHARRSMKTDADKMEKKLDGHVSEYREGSIGGDGADGGGCGCN